MMAKKRPARGEPKAKEVAFEFIKGNFFRVIHADGVWGGLTPHFDIHMDFWSERHPIPKRIVFEVTEEGAIGPEQRDRRESRDAIVREVEVGVVMGIPEAIALRDWLDTKIEQATRLKAGLAADIGAEATASNGKPSQSGDDCETEVGE
jgi:hypothetical protein